MKEKIRERATTGNLSSASGKFARDRIFSSPTAKFRLGDVVKLLTNFFPAHCAFILSQQLKNFPLPASPHDYLVTFGYDLHPGAEGNEFKLFLCYIQNMIRFRKITEDIHTRIDALIDLFQNDPNIVFSYLFGGLLKERLNPLSDVDLSVYLRDPEKLDYLQLISNISSVLGTEEIDLVILNQAPLSLAGRILQNRRVLNDRDPFLRHRYESLVLRKFFDFTLKERDILKGRYGIA